MPRHVFNRVDPNVSEIFRPKIAFSNVIKTLTIPLKSDFISDMITSLIAAESSKLSGGDRAAILDCNFFINNKVIN